MYAIIQTGGKQYRVQPGDTIEVERLGVEPGAQVEIDRVMMVSDGDDVAVGHPFVEGARVQAEVVEAGRGPKLIVFKFKNKTRYRRKNGHRQHFTRLTIQNILRG